MLCVGIDAPCIDNRVTFIQVEQRPLDEMVSTNRSLKSTGIVANLAY